MIPRYLPAVGLSDALRLYASSSNGNTAHPARFVPDTSSWHPYAFERARHGLTAWLRTLPRAGGSRVLVSAQICPAVREAIAAAGLTPAFIDVDDAYPSPSPSQFAAALGGEVVAVIVAPMYGYIQDDWSMLAAVIGATSLCVDMAQGLLLDDRLAVLLGRADAVLYSFSLGKGLDVGGGLLFARTPLPQTGPMDRAPRALMSVVAAGLTWRALVASGLYRACVPLIERQIDRDQHDTNESSVAPPRDPGGRLSDWAARVDAFARDVGRARDRARRIGTLPSVRAGCRDVDVFCNDGGATYLRQVLRLREAARRPRVLEALRRLGIDCAPAGEPLPPSPASDTFPNAVRFASDAIRLPFLGRLRDGEQARVEGALEAAIG